MNVSPAKQIFKCFACGAGGNVITFVMRRERLSFPEAARILAERAGVTLSEQRAEPGAIDRHQLEKVNRWAARFFRGRFEDETEGRRAREYVATRQINDDIARRFGLGWAPDSWDQLRNAAERDGLRADELVRVGLLVERDQGGYYDRFRERLIFPVIDPLSRIIGFGGRALGDDPAKYLNSPESELFDKSRAVYGIHAARNAITKSRTAVVVEGYTDCLMAHQHGVENVVATLGTALTAEHAKVLSRYADRIVLMFDSDEAGRRAATRAIEVFFTQRVEVRLASVPKGKDPCDFLIARGGDAFRAVIDQAMDALDYKWQATLAEVTDDDTISGRRRATEAFLQFVAEGLAQHSIDEIGEGFLVNHVAKLVGAGPEQVHQHVRRFRRRPPRSAAAGGNAPRTPAVADAETAAQREVLEVLLNRPELAALAKETLPDPAAFRDEIHRAVAERLWAYDGAGGETGLAEIIAGVESLQLAEIITEMAARGAQRGNYEDTLVGALRALEQYRQEQDRRQVRTLIATAAQEYGEDAETAALLEYQAKWRPDPRRTGVR